jgi:hypothetical protein
MIIWLFVGFVFLCGVGIGVGWRGQSTRGVTGSMGTSG